MYTAMTLIVVSLHFFFYNEPVKQTRRRWWPGGARSGRALLPGHVEPVGESGGRLNRAWRSRCSPTRSAAGICSAWLPACRTGGDG
jgi:hypothetical protein